MLGIGLANYVPYGLYILGICAVFVAIFSRTEYALLILVPILPLQNLMNKVHELPMGKQFIDVLLLSIFLGCCVRFAKKGERVITKTPLNIPIVLLAGVTLLSVIIGADYYFAGLTLDDVYLQQWKNFVLMPVLYLLVVTTVRDLQFAKLLCFVMILSMIPMDWYFYKTFRWVDQWHYSDSMRLSGTFSYLGPNEIAAFYAQYSFIVLGLFIYDKSRPRRLAYVVILCFNIYCLIYAFSRSGYLAFLIGCLVIAVLVRRKYLVPLVLLLCFWKAILPVSVQERILMTQNEEAATLDSTSETALDGSSEGRLDLWKFGLELFKQNPILGSGKGVYTRLAREVDRYGRRRDPHNMYIKALAEMGVVGLSIYLLVYFIALKSAWGLYRVAPEEWLKGLGLGVFVCTLANMVMNVFHDAYSYVNLMGFYWVFLALVARANITKAELVETT